MRKLLAVAAFGMGLSAFGACGSDGDGTGSVSDPVSACKEITGVTCDKIFACFTKEELDAAQPIVGLNATDCRDKLGVDCTPDKSNCDAGETYHADKAQSCLDGMKTLSCNDIKKDPIPEPAACDQVCSK